MLTGYPGARENAQQLVPVPSVDGLAQRVEVVTKTSSVRSTASRLARKMSCHITGSLPAIRVKSRKPPAAWRKISRFSLRLARSRPG